MPFNAEVCLRVKFQAGVKEENLPKKLRKTVTIDIRNNIEG